MESPAPVAAPWHNVDVARLFYSNNTRDLCTNSSLVTEETNHAVVRRFILLNKLKSVFVFLCSHQDHVTLCKSLAINLCVLIRGRVWAIDRYV